MCKLEYKPLPGEPISLVPPKEEYGIVAIFDALGTRHLTLEGSRNFLKKKDGFIRRILGSIKIADFMRFRGNKENLQLKVRTFGDTFLMFMPVEKGNEHEALFWLARILAPEICDAISIDFLLRGAIAIGDYIFDDYSVIGPAVTEAAEYYEAPDMIGIVLTQRASFSLLQDERLQGDAAIEVKMDYYPFHVNLRPKSISSYARLQLWCLNWPFRLISSTVPSPTEKAPRSKFRVAQARANLLKYLSKGSMPIVASSKYQHTLDFFDAVSADEEISGLLEIMCDPTQHTQST